MSGRASFAAAAAAAEALGAAIAVAWAAGRLLSDRWAWSQWLLWVPTPALLAAAAVCFAAALRPALRPGTRRRRLAVRGGACLAALAYFGAVEHRFGRGGEPAGLRVVHWNAEGAGHADYGAQNEALLGLGADLYLVSAPGPAEAAFATLRAGLGPGAHTAVIGPFVVFTRLEIVEAGALVFAEGVQAAFFRVAAAGLAARPVVIHAVDLPSDPRRGRFEVARDLRRLLDAAGAPEPDLVVGDFNMTRGGRALRAAYPGLEHAWDQAGGGCGATFPRAFPLYHLDHALLAPTLRAADYRLVDPGTSRHRLQVVDLVAGAPE